MTTKDFANYFPVHVPERPGLLFQRPRSTAMKKGSRYSVERSEHFSEAVPSGWESLKEILTTSLWNKIKENKDFFDVAPFGLNFSITNESIIRNSVYSVVKHAELQILYDSKSFYLAAISSFRIYNRIKLGDVIDQIGLQQLKLPLFGICFAGPAGSERWRDCKLLSVNSDGSAAVQVHSLMPAELLLPISRIIPRLPTSQTKMLCRKQGISDAIEMQLKSLRKGQHDDEGVTLWETTKSLMGRFVHPLFPIQLPGLRFELSKEPAKLEELESRRVSPKTDCIVFGASNGIANSSIHEALKHVDLSRTAQDLPVVLFSTERQSHALEHLVSELNNPSETVAGFRGLAHHFGVRLNIVGHRKARTFDDYQFLIEQFTLSPSTASQRPMALIYLPDENDGREMPLYYLIKALLARAGYGSQVVDNETLTNRWAQWNLALNISAKFGQVPWKLRNPSALAPTELFLGISYSSLQNERLGNPRNIAYVNVFDQQGTWKLFFADAMAFAFDERIRVFPKIAADAVRSATDTPESLSLIEVHFNKRFSFEERRAIASGIYRVAPRANILFVSITDKHPVQFFSPDAFQMSTPRGTSVVMSSEAAYLQTIGAQKFIGHPRPLRVQIYRDFCRVPQTVEEVSQRLMALTMLNWRSIRDTAALPVTILYSSLVAKFANYFSLSQWQHIDHELKRTPWFL